jgi:predicted TIM-barrel fold metal-dependent hydrolase
MLITDAQVHIWEADSPARPWPKGPSRPTQEPQKPNGYSAEEMLAEMDAAGVDRAVLVPPTYVGEGNETALEVAQQYPKRFAIMGRFDIKRPDMREALSTWKQQPGMLGIRHTFFGPFREWLDEGGYEPFWSAAEEYEIPVMCLTSGFPEVLGPILERHPGLTLIADHMAANLRERGPKAFEDMLDNLLALAKYPRFMVKVTSAPSISAEPYPFRDIYPHLKRIYEAFGARRLMWGADITRLIGTYPDCLRHFQEGLDFLSEADKEWILGKTVATALNWPEK